MMLETHSFYLLADASAIILSFILALLARFAGLDSRGFILGHWYGCVLLLFIYLLVSLFGRPREPFIKRHLYEEMGAVATANFYMAMILALFLFLFKMGNNSSRQFYILFFLFDMLSMLIGRLIFKAVYFTHFEKSKNRKKILVYAAETNVAAVVGHIIQDESCEYEIAAVAVTRSDGTNGVYQVGCSSTGCFLKEEEQELTEYLKRQVLDEALVYIPEASSQWLDTLITRLEDMGIVVHVTTAMFGLTEKEKAIEQFGPYRVFTYCIRKFEPTELAMKRALDILGGLVGCVITALIFPFVAVAINLESPGPVIFKQTRIGKNGRHFSIYKFRSMYMDAEARKKDLMDKNEMDGLMFKIKDDPRITKVGKFIRKTSIDEFPQFFNVLKGDMSLVGTRPPTVDEFDQYEEHHKRRLSLKPGITGMWQISGRSGVQNFEDIVKMDVEYIDNWSIWLDLKILVRTVGVVVVRKGAE